MIATLGLYDWPELQGATDRLWALTRDHLKSSGLDAPQALDRTVSFAEAARHPDLLLGQTCALPFVRYHRGKVQLVGSFIHDLPGVPAGFYTSALVVRADAPGETLTDFEGCRLAANEPDSWSGVGVLRRLLAPTVRGGRFFKDVIWTGGHRQSMEAVASGKADLAAIDGVYWRIAERDLTMARVFRVLTFSEPVPSLPLITRLGGPVQELATAITHAIAELSNDDRETLLLKGLQHHSDADYQLVADLDRTANEAAYHELSRNL